MSCQYPDLIHSYGRTALGQLALCPGTPEEVSRGGGVLLRA